MKNRVLIRWVLDCQIKGRIKIKTEDKVKEEAIIENAMNEDTPDRKGNEDDPAEKGNEDYSDSKGNEDTPVV